MKTNKPKAIVTVPEKTAARQDLKEVLNQMDEELGPPSAGEMAWARGILRR